MADGNVTAKCLTVGDVLDALWDVDRSVLVDALYDCEFAGGEVVEIRVGAGHVTLVVH